MMMLVTMSMYGTRLISPCSSSASSNCSRMRRMRARTWRFVIVLYPKEATARVDLPLLSSGPMGGFRQQVFQLEREGLQIRVLALGHGAQNGVGDDAEHGDAEAHGGVIECLGLDSVRVQRNWSEDEISLLRVMGEILMGA